MESISSLIFGQSRNIASNTDFDRRNTLGPFVAAGRGRELMLVPGWWYVISAESFLDRMTEMPDVLELAPTIRCPTLFIHGDEESP